MYSKLQKSVAEMFGTAALVFIGPGSVTATLALEKGTKAPFSGADLLGISFAFFFVITAMVYAIGKVSGCHINPAVTFALAVTKRIPWSEAPLYWVSQVVGAIVGALGIFLLFGNVPASQGMSPAVVTTATGAANIGVGFAAEFLGTGLLMFAILGIVDKRAPGDLAGLVIGGAVLAIIMLIGPLTSASLNPARAFGPALIDQLFVTGGPRTAWSAFLPVYVIAGLAGSALAALFYDFLAEPRIVREPIREAVTHPDPGGVAAAAR
jgi:glycerol uptake facilitator protein